MSVTRERYAAQNERSLHARTLRIYGPVRLRNSVSSWNSRALAWLGGDP